MTGFGKATVEMPTKKITVEIKSLNSKQLDASMRVPAVFRSTEPAIRNILGSKLERGKVDLSIMIEHTGTDGAPTLNIPLLQAYKEQIEKMRSALGLPEPADWYATLLRFPDIYHSEQNAEITDDERRALTECVNAAADALTEFRRAEGAKLEQVFRDRVRRIGELLAEVPRFEVERVEKIRRRIDEGLQQLHHAEFDRGRLEQEMIFYIEKLDINEEKQRLASHLSYFIETLEGEPGQGKKLGFIAQEMGREINTLGSKSNQADMQKLVVKMKDELEQIKEQVLNVM